MSPLKGDRREFAKLPGGGYVYRLLDEAVEVEVRYLRRKDAVQHGEVDVRCSWADARHYNGSLSCSDVNLSSQTARKTLAHYCADRARTTPESFDWQHVIDAACLSVIQAERTGGEAIILDDAPEVVEKDLHILGGFTVPGDAASLLIAHGDSLKSLLLLLALGTLAQRGLPTLLLDWEWSSDRHLGRKKRLFGVDRLEGLRYLKCNAPLVVEADRIRRYCDLHKIAFIGVDSIGLACDGKLVDDDVAIRFYRALGTLPPSLCAVHVPKSSLSSDSKTEPEAFGSVFFTNLCRMSWSVKKQPGSSDDVATVGLFPKKQNDGRRVKPVGIEFTFSSAQIMARPVNLADVEGLAERLPLRTRMIEALKHGPKTFTQLAEELGAKLDSVIKAANRTEGITRLTDTPDGIHRIALTERRGMTLIKS